MRASQIAWFVVLVMMGILYCITGVLVGVCQAPTIEKAEFAEIMNSMQIPLLRCAAQCPGELLCVKSLQPRMCTGADGRIPYDQCIWIAVRTAVTSCS